MKRSLLIALVAVQTLPWNAFAQDLFLRSREVEADGVADVAPGKVAEARELAIRNAQRAAIETAVGAWVESRFSAEQRESIKSGSSGPDFMSRVEDKVSSHSAGYIDSQTVLMERRDGALYRVRLRVVVKSEALAVELEKLQGLLAAAGNPKIMLLVAESYRSRAGGPEARMIERPAIVPLIESALLKKGFELADKEREPDASELTAALSDTGRAAQVAARYGAEAAIVGSAEVSQTAYDEGGDRMYYVAAVINLRAVNVSTGKVITSVEELSKSAGASEELARVKAIRAGAPKVIDALLEQLVISWKGEVERGKRFRLNVLDVANYGKEGRPFIKLVREVPNVSAVKELAFNAGRLELEVIFKGTKEELLDGVFELAGSNSRFESLDKAKDRGDEIDLRL